MAPAAFISSSRAAAARVARFSSSNRWTRCALVSAAAASRPDGSGTDAEEDELAFGAVREGGGAREERVDEEERAAED